jgi:hypothetical protein
MREYSRKYPLFSLCGLNCGLCPRYHTEGSSKCPGCGGFDFHLKHPTCAVITCNKNHDQVEYCFQCSSYPCKRYSDPSKRDSFITYENVISDFRKASEFGIRAYQEELNKKIKILELLIKNYNDGRRKGFYCIAVNLIQLNELEQMMKRIDQEIEKQDLDLKGKINLIAELIESTAKKEKIELKLRK